MRNSVRLNRYFMIAMLMAGAFVHANSISVVADTVNSVEISLYSNKDNLIGGWSYTVEGAPEGYQKGFLMIVKSGDTYQVQVQIGGNTLLGENVLVKGNKIQFDVMVQGGKVSVGLVAKGDSISGKSTSQDGTYNITGEKSLSME